MSMRPTWSSRTTRAASAWRAAVRELLESTFEQQPDMRFSGRAHVGDDFVGGDGATATDDQGRRIEWDGIDVFPFRDGLIARKDVYSSSHDPRYLDDTPGRWVSLGE